MKPEKGMFVKIIEDVKKRPDVYFGLITSASKDRITAFVSLDDNSTKSVFPSNFELSDWKIEAAEENEVLQVTQYSIDRQAEKMTQISFDLDEAKNKYERNSKSMQEIKKIISRPTGEK